MREFLSTTTAQAVIWGSVLLILLIAGAYIVKFFRDRDVKSQVSASELLSRFRELQDQGDLSQAEFRHIKSALGPRLHAETRSKDADQDV